jgi:hypothetical protein
MFKMACPTRCGVDTLRRAEDVVLVTLDAV